jgi:hypothetical protein
VKEEPENDRAEPSLTKVESLILDLRREIAARHDEFAAVVVALVAQHGDPTHVTVDRAAALRGESVKTIRRRIAAGELTLEVITGSRQSGIPIEQIYARWIPIRAARMAMQKAREEAMSLTSLSAIHRIPGALHPRKGRRKQKKEL